MDEETDYTRGYEAQMAWLQGKTAEEARLSLTAREATHPDSTGEFNRGANNATREYYLKQVTA